MAEMDIVDRSGVPTGETITREDAHKAGFKGYLPHGHVIIYDTFGNVLVQKRTQKKFLPWHELPIHGGHLDVNDRVVRSDPYSLSYKKGALREANDELKIKLKEEDLTPVIRRGFRKVSRDLDFTEDCGFPNRMYLAIFTARYDSEKHGEINPNKTEVEWAEFKPLEYVVSHLVQDEKQEAQGIPPRHLLEPFKRYGSRVLLKRVIKPDVQRIRSSIDSHASTNYGESLVKRFVKVFRSAL